MKKIIMRYVATSPQHVVKMLFLFVISAMLASCQSAGNDKKKSHTDSVKLSFVAASNINKNSAGEANPVRIMVYQLTQQQAFMASDFITLTENSDPELANQIALDLDVMILPGEKKEKVFKISENVVALGVISAYRNISEAEWKVVYLIPDKPERSWYQRHFRSEEVWQPHVEVRMNNLTTTVKPVN